MKYTLTLVLLVLLCSCTNKETQPPVSEAERVMHIPNVPSVYKFTFEGHDYLYGYRAGIIHSESCKAPNHYAK